MLQQRSASNHKSPNYQQANDVDEENPKPHDDELLDTIEKNMPTLSTTQRSSSSENTFPRYDQKGSSRLLSLIRRIGGLMKTLLCTRKGIFILLLIVFIILLILRWFIFVYNGPDWAIEMTGPVYANKNSESLYLVKTSTKPSFLILTLSPKSDVWISDQLVSRGWWESAIEKTFEEVLDSVFEKPNAECNMIDVGGNLGFFSLLSAAYGCQVSTFEVQPEMVDKIKASAAINGFKNIKVHNNAVTSVSGKTFSFGYGDSYNKGSAYAYESTAASKEKITSVALDDEFRDYIANQKRITILKIDVEGNEGSVIEGAKQLLPLVDNTVVEITRYTLSVLGTLMKAGFNKITVLEEPRMVWGYFVKRAPSQTFINPTYEEVSRFIIEGVGKSDIWLSRI